MDYAAAGPDVRGAPLAVSQILSALAVLGACFVVFGALGRLFPCNPGRPVFFSKSIGLDLGYCALGALYAGVGPAAAALLGAMPAARSLTAAAWIAGAPLWAQTIGLIVVTDFAQYWVHRAFHCRPLWPYHAVHHSAPDVNWTTTFRTHPVNYLIANAALAMLARLVGFSETAILIAAPVFFFSGVWTHANLDWTFGPLRYVIASPVFHRWHHSADAASREKNYAPMFPVWDLMFATFHMPRRARPGRFGADGVPGDLIGQLLHPLRPGARQGADARSGTDAAVGPGARDAARDAA
jgi:sterol desaturase/sphingolipid hydroxylase (fatty acid hydroxylase superfamily)